MGVSELGLGLGLQDPVAYVLSTSSKQQHASYSQCPGKLSLSHHSVQSFGLAPFYLRFTVLVHP